MRFKKLIDPKIRSINQSTLPNEATHRQCYFVFMRHLGRNCNTFDSCEVLIEIFMSTEAATASHRVNGSSFDILGSSAMGKSSFWAVMSLHQSFMIPRITRCQCSVTGQSGTLKRDALL